MTLKRCADGVVVSTAQASDVHRKRVRERKRFMDTGCNHHSRLKALAHGKNVKSRCQECHDYWSLASFRHASAAASARHLSAQNM
jgi:hypothetical protein